MEFKEGHIVNFKNRDDIDYCIITELNELGGCFIDRHFKDGTIDDQPEVIEDLTPITITEEFLVRFDFEQLIIPFYGEPLKFDEFYKNDYKFGICKVGGDHNLWQIYYDGICRFPCIQYIHELQNGFKEYTEEELKFI